jgi:hypothetical protein
MCQEAVSCTWSQKPIVDADGLEGVFEREDEIKAMDEGHCGLPTDELVPLAEKLAAFPHGGLTLAVPGPLLKKTPGATDHGTHRLIRRVRLKNCRHDCLRLLKS